MSGSVAAPTAGPTASAPGTSCPNSDGATCPSSVCTGSGVPAARSPRPASASTSAPLIRSVRRSNCVSKPRVRSRPVRRPQQHLQGDIEGGPSLLELSRCQTGLALCDMALGRGHEHRHGIVRRGGGLRFQERGGRRGANARWHGLQAGCAAGPEHANHEDGRAGQPGSTTHIVLFRPRGWESPESRNHAAGRTGSECQAAV